MTLRSVQKTNPKSYKQDQEGLKSYADMTIYIRYRPS